MQPTTCPTLPRASIRTLTCCLAGLAFVGAATSISSAQATYSQNFDNVAGGMTALESQGWIIRRVSVGGQYVYGITWVEDGTLFPPYQGAGCWYMGASIAPPGTVSNWTILPSIPNQIAGDTLRFYCRNTPSFYGSPSTFEVRYSSGGTNTGGTNPNAVGDFTTVLTTLTNPPANQWFPVTVTVPGNGRIALRGYMNHQSGFQDSMAYCVDSLAFADVRVRIVARDRRFQSSSAEVAISIAPGDGSAPGDVDADGDVDLSDLAQLLSTFGLCNGDVGFNAGADFDQSGCVELGDLAVLLANFGT